MFEISSDWLSPGFERHGHCFVDPLLWLYVALDSWIAFSLSMIPIALAIYVRNRRDLAFYWMFLISAVSSLLAAPRLVWNMEAPKEPVYWLDRSVKAGHCGSVVRDCGNVLVFSRGGSAC
jgi:hypothetical protein